MIEEQIYKKVIDLNKIIINLSKKIQKQKAEFILLSQKNLQLEKEKNEVQKEIKKYITELTEIKQFYEQNKT